MIFAIFKICLYQYQILKKKIEIFENLNDAFYNNQIFIFYKSVWKNSI